MPLPMRAPSVRSPNTEPKPATSRTSRLTTKPQLSKARLPEHAADAKSERQKFDAGSSATSTRDSANNSQASSRIPSPFKRNTSSHSSHSSQLKSGQTKPQDKGHVRQRSAVVPLLEPRQNFGHVRSTSAVSVNSITSSSSHGVPRSVPSVRHDPVQQRSHLTKLKEPSGHVLGALPSATSRSTATHAQLELVQNELLQLAIVHQQSSTTLHAYQRSIERLLAKRQSELSSKRAVVQSQKQAFCATLNLIGLDAWLNVEGVQKMCQSLQNLSVVVKDLQNLESIFEGSDGLAAAFANWQQKMCVRKAGYKAASDDFITLHLAFEDRLVPEIRRFRQQVSSAYASLSNMPDCPPDTSLTSLIQGHSSLATSLMSQCQIMLQIGHHLVADHRAWLQDEVRAAMTPESNLSSDKASHQASSPIWDT